MALAVTSCIALRIHALGFSCAAGNAHAVVASVLAEFPVLPAIVAAAVLEGVRIIRRTAGCADALAFPLRTPDA